MLNNEVLSLENWRNILGILTRQREEYYNTGIWVITFFYNRAYLANKPKDTDFY